MSPNAGVGTMGMQQIKVQDGIGPGSVGESSGVNEVFDSIESSHRHTGTSTQTAATTPVPGSADERHTTADLDDQRRTTRNPAI